MRGGRWDLEGFMDHGTPSQTEVYAMGDGVVIIMQPSHEGPQDVVFHLDDVKALVAALKA